MRLTLDVRGRRYVLDLSGQRVTDADEPEPQGATSGDLERRPGWDHDEREPVGFSSRRLRYGHAPTPDGKPKPPPPVGPGAWSGNDE